MRRKSGLIAYNVALAIEVKEFAPAKKSRRRGPAATSAGRYRRNARSHSAPTTPCASRPGNPALLASSAGWVSAERAASTDEVTEQVWTRGPLRNSRNTEQRLIASQ
jgi:hypothetical protein